MKSFLYLFDSFQRFFGNPHQVKVSSLNDLFYNISINNGKNPCFASFNSFQNGFTVCKSIFNDFDASFTLTCRHCGHEFKESPTPRCVKCGNMSDFSKEPTDSKHIKVIQKIKQAQELAQTYHDYHIPFVPHFTAYKGVHVLPLFKPEKFTNSNLITNLFYFFIEQSKCYHTEEITEIINGVHTKKNVKIPHADTVVVSDLRRLCRLPGTLRSETSLYCGAIDPKMFLNMDPEMVFELAKRPIQSVDVDEPTMKMSDLEFDPVDITKFRPSNISEVEEQMLEMCGEANQFIRDFFPPCLQRLLPAIEPPHEVRYNAVVHLREINMSPTGIIDLMSKIGWRDYSYDTTSYQVGQIYNDSRCKFKCYPMRAFGACEKKNCIRRWR